MDKGIRTIFTEITNKNARSASYLECGYNNDNYLINDSYVIRVKRPNGDQSIIPANEHEVYDSIAKLNISEKIFYFDNKTGTKISRFVHGTRKYYQTPTDEQLIMVAKKLKKLHTSGIKVNFSYSMFDKLNYYKNGVDKALYIDKKYENKIIKDVKSIFDKNEMVLCHNDLVKDNLLFKFDDLVIIDWEYSAMNNPIFDLASFISENNLTKDQENTFLGKYYGAKYNALKKRRVDLFAEFQNILFYYWAEYLLKNRGDEIYSKIAEIKLNRIKEHL